MDLRGSVPTLLSDKKQKPESGECSAPDTTSQVSRTEKQPVDYSSPHAPALPPPSVASFRALFPLPSSELLLRTVC